MKKLFICIVSFLFIYSLMLSNINNVEASSEKFVGSTWKYRIDSASSAKAKHVHFYKKVNGAWSHQLCSYSNGDVCDKSKNKISGFAALPTKVKKAAIADKSTGMGKLCACGFDGGGAGRGFIVKPLFA